jgi:predicted O-methyltransferase YrrM
MDKFNRKTTRSMIVGAKIFGESKESIYLCPSNPTHIEMNSLKRLFVALTRFRCRHGYGVHPPFAFELITDTLYSHPHFYAFRELAALRWKVAHGKPARGRRELEQLFRLVNRFQPKEVVQLGTGDGFSLLYMSAACRQARYGVVAETFSPQVEALWKDAPYLKGVSVNRVWASKQGTAPDFVSALQAQGTIDFLHLTAEVHPAPLWEEAMNHLSPSSFCLIEDIRSTDERRAWWKQVVNDPRVGTAFDLYQRGLLFFDTNKPKQIYKA